MIEVIDNHVHYANRRFDLGRNLRMMHLLDALSIAGEGGVERDQLLGELYPKFAAASLRMRASIRSCFHAECRRARRWLEDREIAVSLICKEVSGKTYFKIVEAKPQ